PLADGSRPPRQDEERRLEGVLGVLLMAEHVAAHPPDEPAVPPHQRRERRLAARGVAPQQLGVGRPAGVAGGGQAAEVLADWCLRVAAVLQAARAGWAPVQSAWHLATVAFIAPFVLLAPLNGVLCNGLPRRGVLVASAAWSLLAVAAGALGVPWLACLGL